MTPMRALSVSMAVVSLSHLATATPVIAGQPTESTKPRALSPTLERPGSGCLLPARRPATPGVPIPAPAGVKVPPGTLIRPTEPNIVSAHARGGHASVRLSLRLQMGINDFTGQPQRGALFGATICRQRSDGRWARVADPRWSVRAGNTTVLMTTTWLRTHSRVAAALTPGHYRIHVGLSYWWGQRNLFVRIT